MKTINDLHSSSWSEDEFKFLVWAVNELGHAIKIPVTIPFDAETLHQLKKRKQQISVLSFESFDNNNYVYVSYKIKSREKLFRCLSGNLTLIKRM